MLPAAFAWLVTAATYLVAIPAEPGAVVLAEGSILEVVAADLDGDGAREVVVLSGGDADGSATPDASGSPLRPLVHQVDGTDRVTLLRQAAADTPCCLTLHDVVRWR